MEKLFTFSEEKNDLKVGKFMADILSSINSPEDLKELDVNSLNKLSGEIREFLIDTVLKTGGHLASNLGVVELTLALHKVFSAPDDDIIFDVGHQSYVHKIICGRREKFSTLRQRGGLSGFPKPEESQYDTFETGHSGTSLSVALGFACSADLKSDKKQVVAVIGDASFSGGLPMEALNCISQLKKKVIIILNDNQMSIEKNRGAFARYLNRVRVKPSYYNAKRETNNFLDKIPLFGGALKKWVKRAKGYIKYLITPGVVFEQLGYKYLGPVNGHDISLLCSTFEEAKKIEGPVIVHVCTTKGKGYKPSEDAPNLFHGVSGKPSGGGKTFTAQFGESMLSLAESDEKVVSICPSMVASCGLENFKNQYKERLFDTGIAEAHAITFAAGMAQKGFKPVVSVYSSFLQRAYDSVLHDVAIGGRHVTLAIDRAGVVGEDGETHQGVFDISFLSHIPGMAILAPCDNEMLHKMLSYAVLKHNGPIAVRYPKGSAPHIGGEFEFGKAAPLTSGGDVTIAALGTMVNTALESFKILAEENISAEVIDLRCAAPIDFETIFKSAEKTGVLVTIEDNVLSGGVGEKIAARAAKSGKTFKVINKAFPNEFIPAAGRGETMEIYGLDKISISKEIKEILNESKA